MGFIANFNELNSAKEAYKNYFVNDIENARSLNTQIENFTNLVNGSDLNGRLWNATRDKVNVYKALNNQRKLAIINFKASVNAALDTLIGSWEGAYFGDEISDEKLAELEAEIDRLQKHIAYLYTILMREVTYTDSEGNTTTVLEEDPAVREAIDQATNEMNKLIMIVRKIKAYRELTYTVISNIESAFSEVSAFGVNAGNVTPTEMWSYTGSGM